MKLNILTQENTKKGTKELPEQFHEPVRSDIIKRAVEALQANARQAYGAKPDAGQTHSAKLSRRRRDYRGSYGHGISRVPRKIHTRRGTRFFWVGALAPGCVGGRRAHPPKVTKIWDKKINVNENRKAIRSAIAATMLKDIVAERGHEVPETYPFMIDDSFESIKETSKLFDALIKLGLTAEIERASRRTYRAGRARRRGRKYKQAKGPLIVVGKQCDLLNSAKNIPGIDIVEVNALNAELLAPGANPGRLTLFTESAISRMAHEKLFSHQPKDKIHEDLSKKKEIPAKRLEKKNDRKEGEEKARQKPKKVKKQEDPAEE